MIDNTPTGPSHPASVFELACLVAEQLKVHCNVCLHICNTKLAILIVRKLENYFCVTVFSSKTLAN